MLQLMIEGAHWKMLMATLGVHLLKNTAFHVSLHHNMTFFDTLFVSPESGRMFQCTPMAVAFS